MRGWLWGGLVLGCLALAGCGSSDEGGLKLTTPLDKMNPDEFCAFYSQFLATNQLSAEIRQTDIQRMRQKGCPAASIPAK